MYDDATERDDEMRIRELIHARVHALAARDARALTSPYGSDVVLFDAVGPLRHFGSGQEVQRANEWLSASRGAIHYDIAELHVDASGDAGFCHYLYRVRGTMTDDTQVQMWVRSTICLRKRAGGWTITHEHSSVPFEPTSGAAETALEP